MQSRQLQTRLCRTLLLLRLLLTLPLLPLSLLVQPLTAHRALPTRLSKQLKPARLAATRPTRRLIACSRSPCRSNSIRFDETKTPRCEPRRFFWSRKFRIDAACSLACEFVRRAVASGEPHSIGHGLTRW